MTTVKITGTSDGIILQQSGHTILVSSDDAIRLARELVDVSESLRDVERERKRQIAELRLWAEERGIAT